MTTLPSDVLHGIIKAQIEGDERLGDRVGGSGHMGYVGYEIDGIEEPKKIETEKGTAYKITYHYTVSVTTEFTVYPDNPPHTYRYEKTITVNDEGKVIETSERRSRS